MGLTSADSRSIRIAGAAGSTTAKGRSRNGGADCQSRLVSPFARLITGQHGTQAGDKLDTWLAAAETEPGQPGLHSLARGIRQDYQAVRNAVTLPWSSGLVEGLNTRTRLLQRQMYGRATFKLLRKRILTS